MKDEKISEKISEKMIHKLKTQGITMSWADGREVTIRITEAEAEQLRQGKPVNLRRAGGGQEP